MTIKAHWVVFSVGACVLSTSSRWSAWNVDLVSLHAERTRRSTVCLALLVLKAGHAPPLSPAYTQLIGTGQPDQAPQLHTYTQATPPSPPPPSYKLRTGQPDQGPYIHTHSLSSSGCATAGGGILAAVLPRPPSRCPRLPPPRRSCRPESSVSRPAPSRHPARLLPPLSPLSASLPLRHWPLLHPPPSRTQSQTCFFGKTKWAWLVELSANTEWRLL